MMNNGVTNNPWLLPQGIEEALPTDAARLESLRRTLLDMYSRWGYQLVMPPMIEYLESLLTGTGYDLNLQTFKLTDQLTGRMMGMRADMTPQVARIDAHQLKQDAPTRLCYMGTVLKTLSDGFGSSRSPMQAGAELYGHGGIESDVEILCLMVETLRAAGIKQLYIDIGHVGIYRGLSQQAGFDKAQEATLFEMMQRKAIPEIEAYLAAQSIDKSVSEMLRLLPELHGGDDCLKRASEAFAVASDDVQSALDYLGRAVDLFRSRVGDVDIHFDLSELRGYHYHTGLLFAAYTPGEGQEIARGGRYDDIGRVFGRARPATGFSTDVKRLLSLVNVDDVVSSSGSVATAIFAPAEGDEALQAMIDELRQQGETVIQALPGQQGGATEMGCSRILSKASGQWQLEDC